MSIEIKLNANLMTCTFISTDIVFELMLKIVAGLHFDETLNNLKFKKLLVLKPVADFCQFQVSDFGGKNPQNPSYVKDDSARPPQRKGLWHYLCSNMLCDKQKWILNSFQQFFHSRTFVTSKVKMVLRVRLLSPGLFHRAVRHVTGRPRLLDGATECFNGLATMNWDCKFPTMVRRKKQRFKN